MIGAKYKLLTSLCTITSRGCCNCLEHAGWHGWLTTRSRVHIRKRKESATLQLVHSPCMKFRGHVKISISACGELNMCSHIHISTDCHVLSKVEWSVALFWHFQFYIRVLIINGHEPLPGMYDVPLRTVGVCHCSVELHLLIRKGNDIT